MKRGGLLLLPGGLVLQPRHAGHVEHDAKDEQRLVAELVQLLLEGLLQLHPALRRGLGLPVEPQAKVVGLEEEGGGGGEINESIQQALTRPPRPSLS